MNTYTQQYKRFKRGEITTQEWQRYCLKMLYKVMEENREVFVRLKNRG